MLLVYKKNFYGCISYFYFFLADLTMGLPFVHIILLVWMSRHGNQKKGILTLRGQKIVWVLEGSFCVERQCRR